MAWSNPAIEQGADYLDQRAAENPGGVGASFNRAAGSDPNDKHLAQGGYHVYFDRLPPNDYSGGSPYGKNTNPRDARPARQHESAGWDLGFNEDDMIIISNRIQAAIDRRDPRLANIREVNIWLDRNADPVNRDQELGWGPNYDPDDSHKSHIHVGAYRDTAHDWETWKGLIDIMLGEEEDDMSAEDKALLKQVASDVKAAKLAALAAKDAAEAALLAGAEGRRLAQVLAGLRPPAPGEKNVVPPVVPFLFALPGNRKLATGERLWSGDGRFNLVAQSDGNLVLRDFVGRPVWYTGTKGSGATLVVQAGTDGNVVLRDAAGRVLWSPYVKGASSLVVQTDGNVVIKDAKGTNIKGVSNGVHV